MKKEYVKEDRFSLGHFRKKIQRLQTVSIDTVSDRP
jgi:hypothetical protein